MAALLVWVLALVGIGLQADRPDSGQAGVSLVIGTVTSTLDGRVSARSLPERLIALGATVEQLVEAGTRSCDHTDGQAGGVEPVRWYVKVTPLRRVSGRVELKIVWQRNVTNAGLMLEPGSREYVAVVTLEPGRSVVLDHVQKLQCGILSVGLEVGLPAAEGRELLEVTVSLVRATGGRERTLAAHSGRVRVGRSIEFLFDAVQAREPSSSPSLAEISVLVVVDRLDSQTIHGSVKVRRVNVREGTSIDDGGSATYRMSGVLPRILTFRVPRDTESPAADPLLVLVQPRRIR